MAHMVSVIAAETGEDDHLRQDAENRDRAMPILSIQSSVAFGSVGNQAATLPLQRLGFEVWPVNTVAFSNHPGYGSWRGRVAAATELADILAGLGERGVLPRCQAVLTGYLGSGDNARVALNAARAVKAVNGNALFCCDPVMGDREEGLYVSDALATFLRDEVVPAADVLVPNSFELGYLVGAGTETVDGAARAAQRMLDGGRRAVAVTSVRANAAAGEAVATLAADRSGVWLVTTPRLETPAKGCRRRVHRALSRPPAPARTDTGGPRTLGVVGVRAARGHRRRRCV